MPKRFKEVFESVKLNFVHCTDKHTETSLRNAMLVIPDQVRLREVADETAFVTAIRHTYAAKIGQNSFVHDVLRFFKRFGR